MTAGFAKLSAEQDMKTAAIIRRHRGLARFV
jgi:hypothetical protein